MSIMKPIILSLQLKSLFTVKDEAEFTDNI